MADTPPAAENLSGLTWRCIGPPRGGRVVAVAGHPTERMTFYFGACAGGIWKTTDGGTYWRCVSDGFMTSSSVGAIAVSRSDPNVIYAGTGETTIRLDVSYGDGVYRSTDAGRSWTHVGLRETKHIGRVLIHPHDPDTVWVAALGDIFGPSEERGVYRTTDGGKNWRKVLHRDANTGAVELSLDPNNPRIVFATFWQTRRNFWNLSSGGPGSGLFRSMDGGDTWEEISRAPGLPKAALGKLGVAVSPARSGRVWALIEAAEDETGLYRSEDYGASWKLVSPNRDLMHRPWYYTHVFADPCDGETVYVTNFQMWKSTDGGTSFTEINTPHGDNHDLWIDPADPNRMVEGNDGGACVSFNGGDTWSTIYNQLTAQFYRMDIDDQYPYRVYATQQDNTSIAVPSAATWGAITLGDCTYPGTGESGFIAVHPADPNLVFCGAVGSSPGGAGALQRYDYRTGGIELRNVWPEEATGIAPKDLKYRFAWTYPIAFCPHDSGVLYVAGNHVFRSRTEGMDWEEISPDLSLNDKSRQGHSGGDITHESAGAEVHATCACLAPSRHRKGEIWASTDDGLVHVTRDDGGAWHNVTPPGMPPLAYVGCVEISAHDADTVYVSATRYKLADYDPHLFRTRDGGRSWESINGDFPKGEITRVIRADPTVPGLLFAGTETGVFFSLDDGIHWSRMQGGLPVAPVYDMKLKNADLVVATHGRSFWILDDITPLRALAGCGGGTRLFPPRPAVRTRLHFGAYSGGKAGTTTSLCFGIGGGITSGDRPDGTRHREHLDVGENPPAGAIVYYWLQDGAGPVVLTFSDAAGAEIIRFASDDDSLPAAKRPTTRPGLNRYVWDLRHPGPEKLDASLATPKYKPLVGDGDAPVGPVAVPGTYQVALGAGDASASARFVIEKDPRIAATQEQLERQFALLRALSGSLGALNAGVNRIRRARRQLAGLGEARADIAAKAKSAGEALLAIESRLLDVHRATPRDVLRNPAGLNDTLGKLFALVTMSDAGPTTQAEALAREIMAKVQTQLDGLAAVMQGEVAEVNRLSAAAGIAHVTG